MEVAFACDIGTNRPNGSRSVSTQVIHLYPSCLQCGQCACPEIQSCEFHNKAWKRIGFRKRFPEVGIELVLIQRNLCLMLTARESKPS